MGRDADGGSGGDGDTKLCGVHGSEKPGRSALNNLFPESPGIIISSSFSGNPILCDHL